MEKLLESFLRYVKIDTQSDESSKSYPSTEKQFNLAKLLVEELKELGIDDAYLDSNCYVTATIKSNYRGEKKKIPIIGFIAHMDTATNISGENVKPNIIKNYKGGDIALPKNGVIISVKDNPFLNNCIGDTIVTADGTTLLGADDKAGIAAIMELARILKSNSSIMHGDIKIAFTPDEEIGQGVKYFDIEKFGADFAYTVDGGLPGNINMETFSANSAKVEFIGVDIHPGKAKNKMVNAVRAASDFVSMLPRELSPERTDGYEAFIHPHKMSCEVDKAAVEMLLRDFKTSGLNEHKKIIESIIKKTEEKNPGISIKLTISESYRNMKDYIADKKEVFEYLWNAVKEVGLEPVWEPIRGGTDGSKLSERGLPTPNIFTGGNNAHSYTEWLSLKSLKLTLDTLIALAEKPIQ